MNKRYWFLITTMGLVLISSCNSPTLTPQASPALVLPTITNTPESAQQPDETDVPAGADIEFNTDFSRHSIPLEEIISGGPPRDGIPALRDPGFVSVAEADLWLKDNEPVILLRMEDETQAYPLQVLIWHEIVNATINDIPVAVTFCPLCNTAIAYDRRFDELVLEFGTTGRLRYSNLIMYDRQTETWWQQATGEGLIGEYSGQSLTPLPATIIAWRDFRGTYPDGYVLSRETGYDRPYGQNPYVGYDDVDNTPLLYNGPRIPGQLPAMARVLAVEINNDPVAYPYNELQAMHVVQDNVGGEDIVIFWQTGTASALDHGRVDQGKDVGTASVFIAKLDGRKLDFFFDGVHVIDKQTGSAWTVLGKAVSGDYQGRQLEAIVSVNHFWFSWAAFKPETRVYVPELKINESELAESISEPPAVQNSADRLLMDFEIIFYQSAFEADTAQFSALFENGNPTVLVFWAGLCPVCRREMPDIQTAFERYGDRVNFIGIDVGMYTNLGSREDALALIDELGLAFPLGATMEFEVMPTYEVTAIPTTIFMKPDGQILRKENSLLSLDALISHIDTLLAYSEL